MRIQILELPAVVVGENVTTPFALIFDQLAPAEHAAQAQDRGERMANLTNAIGASGFFATPETVEIVDRFQNVEVATECAEEKPRPSQIDVKCYGDPAEVIAGIRRNFIQYPFI